MAIKLCPGDLKAIKKKEVNKKMDMKVIDSMGIPQKIKEVYLAAEGPNSMNKWRTVRVNKSEGIQVIIELLRKNSKKVST